VHQSLGQHSGRRGPVTGDIVGLGRHLLGQLSAEVFVRVVELDFAGHRDAIIGDGRRTPLLVQHDVAALRTEGDVVIFSKYGGTEVKYDGEELLLLNARDILAVVTK